MSDQDICILMQLMSQKDGVIYTSYLCLRLSRPVICLSGNGGEQKTIAVETAKKLIKEFPHGKDA